MTINKIAQAVFLDRDGVINRRPIAHEYVRSWEEFEFLPGVAEAVRVLKVSGFLVFVVTNQRGVATGALTDEALRLLHDRMRAELEAVGSALDGIFYCPHSENKCECRKPRTGLFEQAKAIFPQIEFRESFVVGDSWRDTEAGRRLGCRTILIGSTLEVDAVTRADFVARSLLDAVTNYILRQWSRA